MNLNRPTSIASFSDRFSFTDAADFRASLTTYSVAFMSPKIQARVGILKLNFFSVLCHSASISFSHRYSCYPRLNPKSIESLLKGVSNNPFPVIVTIVSSCSFPSTGDMLVSVIK